MPAHAQASSKSTASVVLAISHYTIGIAPTETPDPWNDRVYQASLIGSQGCGQQLTQDSFRAAMNDFLAWYAQDETQMTDVFDSMVAAAKALNKNWKAGDAGKERLLVALESLGMGERRDQTPTDLATQSLRSVMRHMNVD